MDTRRVAVRSQLLRFLNTRKKQDNNYFIARGILDHFHGISDMTINELAEMCYVSVAAVSRFIRLLDFPSYGAFKEAVEKEIDIGRDYSTKMRALPEDQKEHFISEYTGNLIENLSYVRDRISVEQLCDIVSEIHKAEDVGVFGLEFAAFMGQHFQNKMASMDKTIHTGFTIEEQLELIQKIAPDGLAMIFSMEGGFFYFYEKVIDALKEKRVKIIAFTMKDSSIIQRSADIVIACGTINEDTEWRLSILYMMELLIYYYMQAYHREIHVDVSEK